MQKGVCRQDQGTMDGRGYQHMMAETTTIESPVRGVFIVIDGPTGTGKSSLARHLAVAFGQLTKQTITVTSDPLAARGWWDQGNPICRTLREARDGRYGRVLDDVDLAMLYCLNRRRISRYFDGVLSQGTHILCDRWYYSTLAYQGMDNSALRRCIQTFHRELELLVPDLLILTDASFVNARFRLDTRISGEGLRYVDRGFTSERYERIRCIYQSIPRFLPGKGIVVRVSGDSDLTTFLADGAAALEEFLASRRPDLLSGKPTEVVA